MNRYVYFFLSILCFFCALIISFDILILALKFVGAIILVLLGVSLYEKGEEENE